MFGSSASRSSRAASSASRRSSRQGRARIEPTRADGPPAGAGDALAIGKATPRAVVPSPPRGVTRFSRASKTPPRSHRHVSEERRSARCASRRCATRPPRFSFRQKRARRRGGRARIITTSAARVRCARASARRCPCAARRPDDALAVPDPAGRPAGLVRGGRRERRREALASGGARGAQGARPVRLATPRARRLAECTVTVEETVESSRNPPDVRHAARESATGCSPRGPRRRRRSSSCARWSRPVACWSTSRARSRVPGRGKRERSRTKARRARRRSENRKKKKTTPTFRPVRNLPGRTSGSGFRSARRRAATRPRSRDTPTRGSRTGTRTGAGRWTSRRCRRAGQDAAVLGKRSPLGDPSCARAKGARSTSNAVRRRRRRLRRRFVRAAADGGGGGARGARASSTPSGRCSARTAPRASTGPRSSRRTGSRRPSWRTRGWASAPAARGRRRAATARWKTRHLDARLDAVRDSNIPMFPLPRVRRAFSARGRASER